MKTENGKIYCDKCFLLIGLGQKMVGSRNEIKGISIDYHYDPCWLVIQEKKKKPALK